MFDAILRHSLILDGLGGDPFYGDIAIKGSRIVEISPEIKKAGALEYDCTGCCVAPGFIDSHTHDDNAVIEMPEMLCKLTQGITTVVTGNCGISMAPLTKDPTAYRPFDLLSKNKGSFFESMEEYILRLRDKPPSVNVYPLVGHAALRISAQSDPRSLSGEDDIHRMVDLLDKALSQGGHGISLGIEYPLGQTIHKQEIISLLECVREHQGVVSVHIRTEGDEILPALQESFSLNPFTDIPMIISHHKCAGVKNFGRSFETLRLIDREAESKNVALDAYPYTVASTVLQMGFVQLSQKTIISASEPYPQYIGFELEAVCSMVGKSKEDVVAMLSPAKALYHVMSEEDVSRILSHPLCMLGSDGLHDHHPHPRLWGSFPRFLGKYVREQKLLSLQEAVRKITYLPAQVYKMSGRGTLCEGAYADIVVFNPSRISDVADFEHVAPSEGIEYVFVNGVLSVKGGCFSGVCAGKVL